MAVTTWDATVELGAPVQGEEVLAAIVAALPPGGSAGRAVGREALVVGMTVRAVDLAGAVALATGLARHAAMSAGVDEALCTPVGVEVITEEAAEQRTEHVGEPQDLISVTEAAEILGLTPAAMRLRAQNGRHGAVKIGKSGWAFIRALVEANERAAGEPALRLSELRRTRPETGLPDADD